ncbi:hypothetical protein LshimejAT787_1103260 [Lyophyllum shimeji]|uniref:Uncharacterized protein n=1 Tax=Lyophyllum shimeji TaxID=47721 RepID=A0A9P3UTM5_LYOSH|nr:hypothetical protein LshimejAT787_1103260 [Lyophyllum shimeji]
MTTPDIVVAEGDAIQVTTSGSNVLTSQFLVAGEYRAKCFEKANQTVEILAGSPGAPYPKTARPKAWRELMPPITSTFPIILPSSWTLRVSFVPSIFLRHLSFQPIV